MFYQPNVYCLKSVILWLNGSYLMILFAKHSSVSILFFISLMLSKKDFIEKIQFRNEKLHQRPIPLLLFL